MKQDIFKSDNGSPVEPPDNVKTLLNNVKAAVEKYIESAPHFENEPDAVTRWGGCPECHENHGYVFVGNDTWFVC